jgi:hypothetical protein
MRFQGRFDLPNAIHGRDNEVAIPGTDVSSGRPVTVHLLLGGESVETIELLRNVSSLSPERRQQILEEGNYEGIPYVVTYPLPGNSSLRAWVSAPEVQRPTQVLRPAGYKTPEPGEFTRLFRARSFEPMPEADVKTTPSASTPAPSEALPKVGEFTALLNSFAPQKETRNAPAAEPKPPVVAKPSAPPSEPGEFTRMMRSPLAPETDVPAAKPAKSSAPGEFTRLVQGDLGLDIQGKRDPVPLHEPPQQSGEFTRMVEEDEPRSNDLFSSVAPASSPLPSNRFATGAFSSRAVPPDPAPAAGPSEFTRIISSPIGPPAPIAPQTPVAPPPIPAMSQAKAPATKRRTSYAPLIIILAAVLVVALILIVLFALQH